MSILGNKTETIELLLKDVLSELKTIKDEINVLRKDVDELKKDEIADTTKIVSAIQTSLDNQVKIDKCIRCINDAYIEPTYNNVRNMYNDIERDLKEIKDKI